MDLVAVWYENNLSESERSAIVRNFAGAMEYGLARSWNCLSEHVRLVIRREYRKALLDAVTNAEETLADAQDDTSVLQGTQEIATLRDNVVAAKKALADYA
jgi:hypothetical protein